jgi:outer membrane biosynthesis protein TonB
MADTQEKEQVKFDWTDDSVTEALPTMNRDIVTSVESVELVEPVAIKDDFVVVDYPVTTESSAVTESATTETVTDPVAEPVIEPVVKAITEPATEAVAEPVAETIVEPVVEPVVEPIVEKETPKRPLSSSLTASAPEFIPKSLQQPQPQQKRSTRKFLTREQLIEQQRQHHMPRSKARCSHWPHCTNNNCKFFHPYRTCR